MLDSIGNMPMQYDLFTPVEIKSAIEGMKGNKASGNDNVFAEHLKYAGAIIHVLLSIWFNACMVHGFLPSTMTDTILVPIIKDKTGNASTKANYRPIALTSVLSKVFETALLSKLESVFETSDYQFGFKSHHSTDLCICSKNPQLDSAVEGDPRSRRTGSWLGWKDGGEADALT